MKMTTGETIFAKSLPLTHHVFLQPVESGSKESDCQQLDRPEHAADFR